MISALKTPRVLALVLFALTGAMQHAKADDFGGADIDPRFQAKIIKEKARQAAISNSNVKRLQDKGSDPSAQCGSQNIGVIDTGNRPGAMPREVFVFAPNAINVVSGRGCGG